MCAVLCCAVLRWSWLCVHLGCAQEIICLPVWRTKQKTAIEWNLFNMFTRSFVFWFDRNKHQIGVSSKRRPEHHSTFNLIDVNIFCYLLCETHKPFFKRKTKQSRPFLRVLLLWILINIYFELLFCFFLVWFSDFTIACDGSRRWRVGYVITLFGQTRSMPLPCSASNICCRPHYNAYKSSN